MAPPSLQWLTTLKATQLKTLAAAVGINSSGTKPTLITALRSHLPVGFFPLDETPSPTKSANSKQQQQQHSIISIDMGIRNLAYCHLTLPPTWPHHRHEPPSPPTPTILHWARIAIASPPPATNPTPSKDPLPPPLLASHAYTLITTLLALPPTATQILIERQRFRSMSGAAVQEWTLRVNMFEAMLYAVVRTLQERGEWAGSVKGVGAGRVGRLWVPGGAAPEGEGGDGEGKGSRGRGKMASRAAGVKTAKIRVVEGWLGEVLEGGEDRGRFRLEGEARGMGEGFLRKRRGGKGGGGQVGKLDDLADCLLQGMAWVRWEENRRRVIEEGGVGGLEQVD